MGRSVCPGRLMKRDMLPEKLYGIIGYPLGHSLSPTLHNWAFDQTGVAAVYMAWPLPPERLESFVRAVRVLPVSGVSVTIPHKQKVMQFVDRVSDLAGRVGAVNTLCLRKDGLFGDNTDVYGFMGPLKELSRIPESAFVLGAGGAARAVVIGLMELGVQEIFIANRTHERARDLAEEFGLNTVSWPERYKCSAELLVNATPLGMAGKSQEKSPLPGACFSPNQTVYDLVYNPLRTRFLRDAEHCGCRTIDGLSMFIHQAAAQFRLWTGREFSFDGAMSLLASLLYGQ